MIVGSKIADLQVLVPRRPQPSLRGAVGTFRHSLSIVESPATVGKIGSQDDFGTTSAPKVRGVYVSAGGRSGVRRVSRCRTSLRKRGGRSVGQGKAVRPCRRQPEG